MTTHRLTADPAAAGLRLDVWLSDALSITRSAAVRLIEDGGVRVDGKPAPKRLKLTGREMVEADVPDPVPAEAQPEDIPLDIVYEDTDIIVVNKPAGMVVHPAAGNPTGTLVNALLWHCGERLSGIGGVIRPGIVHRIDKDTSGLLVVAKHDEAHLTLAAGLKDHAIARVYSAIAIGNLREDDGTVDAPIGRHPTDRKRMAVIRDGSAREAVTHYRVTERFEGFCCVECRLETGRTHQIRVHMASLGHPLLGDPVYGGDKTAFERHHASLIHGQCLHARELHFVHPRTGEPMRFTAPLPTDFAAVLEILRGSGR